MSTQPTELDRLDIEVHADAGQVVLLLPAEGRGIVSLTPAAALELAARLREKATSIQQPQARNPTCRGVIRNGFHCLCWRSTRNHPSGLCPMHRRAVEQGEAGLVG